MRPINISTIIGSTVPVETQFSLFHEAGFNGVFTTYTGSEPIEAWVESAIKNNLEFETIHAPFERANCLWEGGLSGRAYLDFLESVIIDTCYRIQVDKCIMHVTVGNTAPAVSHEGIALFLELCDYAKTKQVHLCFENLEPLPHIDSIMENITDTFHGFCWDCGHNACYTPHIDMMKKFGSRLKCIHLHDNFGVTQPGNIDYRDDRHLLPFDGILDWDWVTKQLNIHKYKGPVTMELSIKGKPEYRQMELSDYIVEAYKRGCIIREKLDE